MESEIENTRANATYLNPVEQVTRVLVHNAVLTRKRRRRTIQAAVRRVVRTASFAWGGCRVLPDPLVHQDPVGEFVLILHPLLEH